MEFLNCRIDLSKWNFRPRAETEFWVKKAISAVSRRSQRYGVFEVLDMFAGSGCIGIAVLKNIKNSRVDFADIDKKALEQIKINLKLNKISPGRCKIYQSDLFKKLKNKKYHFIFANPPYVAEERRGEVQPQVLKYEPKRALFAGPQGLDAIKKFLKEAKKHLKKKGAVFMEFDPLQKADIELILIKEKYRKFKFNKDQFGKWRWLKIIC